MAASAASVNPRADAILRRIADLRTDAPRQEAIVLGLVDGLLTGDGPTLDAALVALRDARARAADDPQLLGWLDAVIAVCVSGLDRLGSHEGVAPGTQAHAFLRALDGAQHVGSTELRAMLGVDETQVSRTGRGLLERGLVARRKAGRQVFWQLTPQGRRALDGAGDAPGAADATREHIVETTLALHMSRGIQATTWAEIAVEAGVAEETIRALFPTHDDLVRSCGRHFMQQLGVPPADRAADVFAGAATEHERVGRLVGTFFRAYERGADGITAARRELDEVPALEETVNETEARFDALVAEALGPRDPERAWVESLRSLTDVEVWRTLRERGASPDAAVDQATAAVERWLATRPTAR